MNKKVVGGLGIVFFIVIGIFFVLYKTSQKPISPLSQNSTPAVFPAKTPSKELREYKDESGFAFDYPKDATVSAQDTKDSSLYSYVLLTSKEASGSVGVKISDTKFTSLDEWFKNSKEAKSQKPKETKLANFAAYEIKSIDNDTIATVALDKGILFVISLDPQKDKDFWQGVYKTVLASFTFSNPQANQGSNSDSSQSSGEDVVEEDDTVE